MFTVANGVLNYTTSGSVSANDQDGWDWIANYGSYTSDWSLRVDVTIGCFPMGPNQFASVEMYVTKLSGNDFFRVVLRRDGTSSRSLYAHVISQGVFLGSVFVPTSSTTVSLGLSYNSGNHTIIAGYDGDGPANGYLFTPFFSTNIASGAANWAMAASDVFQTRILAQTAEIPISEGQVYLDNFVASSSQLPWVASNLGTPSITVQPQNQTVVLGNNVTFSILATGAQPLTYQWLQNGVAIPGAAGAAYSSYTICSVQTNQAGKYTVVVTNALGVLSSGPAVLTVNVPPSITAQPVSRVVAAGTSATFSVTASGTAPLSYQWFSNSVAVSGATAASYTINPVQLIDAGDYMVRVSNVAGTVDTAVATLTVQYPPVILTQPQGQAVTIGSNATFSVVAGGNPNPTYQWKFNGTNIPGATASRYTRNNVQPSDAGAYTVALTNSLGSVASQPAVLIANHPPTVGFTVSTNATGFFSPAAITLTASAADSDGTI
ncbi:MAG: immunoglobulin domain-containing protein, partial [Limisphaerales bacterium]